MTTPLVTVAIPFAQVSLPHLEDAVRSVLAQTHQNWELLLLPDGTFPELHQRLSRISDPRVRLLPGTSNRGLAARLNEVSGLASGAYLARMDADDLMHPRRLEDSVRVLAQGWDLVGTRAYLIDGDTRVRGAYREGPLPGAPAGYLRSNAFTHPTVTGRTEWFRDHPYDEALKRSEDKELWLRAAPTSRFVKIDERLFYYRVSDLSPAKQARDAAHDRRILRTYGPPLVGSRRTTAMVARSWVKQQVFGVASRALGEDALLRRKSEPLTNDELTAAEDVLRRVRSVALQ